MNINDLYIQLDQNPADAILRRAIRDMHEELGEDELCLGHDYLLQHQKHPTTLLSGRVILYTNASEEVEASAKIPHPLLIHLCHRSFVFPATLQEENNYALNYHLSKAIKKYRLLLSDSSRFVARQNVIFRGKSLLTSYYDGNEYVFRLYQESNGNMLEMSYYRTTSTESAYDYQERFLYL